MIRIDALAAALGLDFAGDPALEIDRPRHPAEAGAADIAVAMDPALAPLLADSPARAAILPEGADWQGAGLAAALFAPRPRYAMAGITATFQHPLDTPAGIHPSAVIDPGARIGPDAAIGPFVVIGAGARIGARVRIRAQVFIGEGAEIGDDALIHAGVRIGARVRIGHRFICQPGAAIGGDGFSFVTPEPGAVEAAKARGASDVAGAAATVHARIHSLGSVRIGDDVEVGANATIDNGTLRDTTVGDGTKIDNQVQLGHNVQVGRHCLICAQAGVAGSTEIGDRVVLGGQAGVADHIRIGHDSLIAAGSGVGAQVPPRSIMMGVPAVKRDEFFRMTMALRRLPRFMDKIRRGEG
ncbi:MAG: UDP-3-O-(3-hydroxymyristoyl)glucosamine N-acyltransferase [Pseudomonadota bacterium]|nr:UDP-3-O-(3-hydroxymyristoyl)glucosamine N-acyltransferase [Pseudomonadota bacterium]